MPAKITVKAELANLLAKSQETTDANRQAQLRKEADRKEDRRRLKAKRAKETAATKKSLEDPVGRNIFTAAMGGSPLRLGRVFMDFPLNLVGQNAFIVWSGDGLASATVETPLVDPQQFVTWNITGEAPENVSSEYGEPGWFRFAPNTVYNVGNLAPNVEPEYSETGGDFRFRELPGEIRPWDVIIQRQPDILANGTTYNIGITVLPIGGEACVIVVTWDVVTTGILIAVDGYEVSRIVSQGGNVVSGTAAFYADRTSARVITVPAGIAGRPTITTGTAVDGDFNVPIISDSWWKAIGPTWIGNAWQFTGNSDDNYGPYIQPTNFHTPVEYVWISSPAAQDLLDSSGYTTGAGDVPTSGVRALLPGNVANFKETLFVEDITYGTSTTFSLRPDVLQRNDLADFVEDGVYDLDDPGWKKAKVKPLPDVTLGFTAASLRFWDWDKPAYCRQQLAALGFLPADLAPLPPAP